MGCFCCRCCFSRKKHKSFPIREKQEKPETNKVFIKHVETVRQTPPPPPPSNSKTTISKRTVKKTSDELKVNRATTKEKNAVDSRQSAVKLFGKTKHMKTPSPLPITTNDISEATHKRTSINLPSNSSTSIDSDSMKQKRNSKHRSFVESYNVSKEYSIQKSNNPPSRKPSNRNKSPAKSKLVLENVRKMIKDQHVQQQHFNHNQQKESVRL